MQQFTGTEYINIDIANQYGFDKLTWSKRLEWSSTQSCIDLYEQSDDAKEPVLFRKAVRARMSAESKIPTGFIMGLDATASGLQIMACLSGCEATAAAVNLINSGTREDVYQAVADIMSNASEEEYSKEIVKPPVMTTFYGSKNQPKQVFGVDTPALELFYEVIGYLLPGALECMEDMQGCWDPEAYRHSWTLPDGHRAVVPVMQRVDKKIEIDELDHATFTHRMYINEPSPTGLSLAANIVHSIDGYVVREQIRKAHIAGFALLSIHDSFWASPNYMNQVRQNYLDTLIEIAQSNLLQDILREICEPNLIHKKMSHTLPEQMISAEYALS